MINEIMRYFYKEVLLLEKLNWRKFKIGSLDHNYYSDRELDIIRDYYEYYCTEDGLYVIKDNRLNSFYFTYSRSSIGALQNFFLNKDTWGMRE